MRLAVRCSILAGLIALAAAPTAGASLHGTIARHSFDSRALARKARYSVYLPPGYAGSSMRYPVIYFLHGLPGSSTSYRAIGWFAAALERTRNRAIVIGAQGARHGQTDDEWLDRGRGRNWEPATARGLVAVVDRRYRTLATRAGRAIVGVSAGGYGAALIGFHHPGTFSAIQSWSGYFRPPSPRAAPSAPPPRRARGSSPSPQSEQTSGPACTRSFPSCASGWAATTR